MTAAPRHVIVGTGAIRGLAGCAALHIRHHGHRRQSDFHLHRPTS
jgi:hypothetical protein